MVTLQQVQTGLVKYADAELMPKIVGWQKWVFGAAISISLSKISNIFNALKDNAFIKMLDVIDENNMIDIDTIHREFAKQAQHGAITFSVPILNMPLTLDLSDVDKIYHFIKGDY
jgi:hypothetical protein